MQKQIRCTYRLHVRVLASSQKLGLTSGVTLVLPWAIFLGACVQLIACFYDFKHGI